MKPISNFFKSGFRSCTGHSLATHLYYYEGKPQIGFTIRKHYVMFWIPGYDRVGVYVTQQEAVEDAKKLGITL
jgi:hypothetical protein